MGGQIGHVHTSRSWFVAICSFLLAITQVHPSLRGTVTSAETGQPLGYSIVTLYPISGKQFTDAAGTFTFDVSRTGSYVLSVRQIGYTPLDSQIIVQADTAGATVVNVALRRLAIELPPVTIAVLPCGDPGAPDSSDAALLNVFDQLQENARRYELLAQSYPFRYDLEIAERTVNQRGDTGKPTRWRLHFSSRDTRPYQVGRVIEPAWGPWRNPMGTHLIHDTDLADLGNENFIANHCFRLAGTDTLGGEALIRIDFEPAMRIVTADMAGSAYLDPESFQVRYTTTWITRPERSELDDLRSVIFFTRFGSIAPGVPLQDSLSVVTTYRYSRSIKIQTQRTSDVRFTNRKPPH